MGRPATLKDVLLRLRFFWEAKMGICIRCGDRTETTNLFWNRKAIRRLRCGEVLEGEGLVCISRRDCERRKRRLK